MKKKVTKNVIKKRPNRKIYRKQSTENVIENRT